MAFVPRHHVAVAARHSGARIGRSSLGKACLNVSSRLQPVERPTPLYPAATIAPASTANSHDAVASTYKAQRS